jgi:hypothetical protein
MKRDGDNHRFGRRLFHMDSDFPAALPRGL